MKAFYLRNEKRFPVALVLSQETHDELIEATVVTHNPLDTYDRELAWDIALGRLNKKGNNFNPNILVLDQGPLIKQRLLKNIVEGVVVLANGTVKPRFPQRTREAARLWLEASRKRDATC